MFDRKAYNLRRYHRLRQEYIQVLGGFCVDCGETEGLEFDHVDPSTKCFDVSSYMTYPREIVLAELSKCVLRCKDHHLAKTINTSGVEHGGGASGKRNCPCGPCKARKAEYMRNYKRK